MAKIAEGELRLTEAMMGGDKAVAWLTAKQAANVKVIERLYNLELVDIEKLAGTLEYLASHRLDTALPSASTDILAQIDDAFKTYVEDTAGAAVGGGCTEDFLRGVS